MRVVVCDDDCDNINHICILLNKYSLHTNQVFHILKFSSGELLLNRYPNEIDLIFLDIDVDSFSDYDIAKRIREIDKNVSMIITSSTMEHAVDCYLLRTFSYLLKPLNEKIFTHELTDVVSIIKKRNQQLMTAINQHGLFRINIDNIYMIETGDHKILIHTEKGIFISSQKISEIESIYRTFGLFRCHKSFIVNALFIESVLVDSVILCKGYKVPISRHRKKEFIDNLNQFWDLRHDQSTE